MAVDDGESMSGEVRLVADGGAQLLFGEIFFDCNDGEVDAGAGSEAAEEGAKLIDDDTDKTN